MQKQNSRRTPQCYVGGVPVCQDTARQAWLKANLWKPDTARALFVAALHPQGKTSRNLVLEAGIEIVFPET